MSDPRIATDPHDGCLLQRGHDCRPTVDPTSWYAQGLLAEIASKFSLFCWLIKNSVKMLRKHDTPPHVDLSVFLSRCSSTFPRQTTQSQGTIYRNVEMRSWARAEQQHKPPTGAAIATARSALVLQGSPTHSDKNQTPPQQHDNKDTLDLSSVAKQSEIDTHINIIS